MAYQAKRQKQFQEDLELCDENGTVVETLHVTIDADSMVRKIHHKYVELCKTLTSVQEIKRTVGEQNPDTMGKALDELGNSVIHLFQAVFGDEDAEKIIQFYEGNYVEMCQEITPFITHVVIPKCNEIKKQNRESVLQGYNRKQRRVLFKK